MIALILFMFIAGGQHPKTQPKAPNVDCEYYRCNDSIVMRDDLYYSAQKLCVGSDEVGDYSGEWSCVPEVLPGIHLTPPSTAKIRLSLDPPYTYHYSDDPSADEPTSKKAPRKYFNGITRGRDTPYDYYTYKPSGEVSESITVQDGSTMVKLPDSEYLHLQELRKAVTDEEKRLAVKYGADPGHDPCPAIPGEACISRPADHYEYHNQFLLIEKGK